MYGGEVQTRRKTLAVLQDEARRVLDAARDLPIAYTALIKKDRKGLQGAISRIRKAEDDVEALRRSLTRELAEVGTMVMNREDVLRTAYSIEDIAGYISAIVFRLSQVKERAFKGRGFRDEVKDLVDMAVESVHKLNEAVLALSINPGHAIELANGIQGIEKEVDNRYRTLTVKIMNDSSSAKDLIMLKDLIEGVENMADRCLDASDSITILALGL